jgi:hypothetical protein
MMKLNRSKQMQRFALLKPARYFWKSVEGLGGGDIPGDIPGDEAPPDMFGDVGRDTLVELRRRRAK